jgi:hypothetical protein
MSKFCDGCGAPLTGSACRYCGGKLPYRYKFSDLMWRRDPSRSEHDPQAAQAVITFPNGHGASVICGSHAFSDKEHPYELGVTLGGGLCYTTPISKDVIGHLNEKQVEELLNKIASL